MFSSERLVSKDPFKEHEDLKIPVLEAADKDENVFKDFKNIFRLFEMSVKKDAGAHCVTGAKAKESLVWLHYKGLFELVSLLGSASLLQLPPVPKCPEDLTRSVKGDTNLLEAAGGVKAKSEERDCLAPHQILQADAHQPRDKNLPLDPNLTVESHARDLTKPGQFRLAGARKLRAVGVRASGKNPANVLSIILCGAAYGFTVFLFSETVTDTQILQIANAAHLVTIFGDENQIPSLLDELKSCEKRPSELKNLISFSSVAQADKLTAGRDHDVRLMLWDNLLDLAKKSRLPPSPAAPDRLALVIFGGEHNVDSTVGTMVTQRMLVACTNAMLTRTTDLFSSNTVHYSIRSLWDLTELAVIFATLASGGRLVFSSLPTITRSSLSELAGKTDRYMEELLPEMQQAGPTFLYIFPGFAAALRREAFAMLTVERGGFLKGRTEKALMGGPNLLKEGTPRRGALPLFVKGKFEAFSAKYFRTVQRLLISHEVPEFLVRFCSFLRPVPATRIASGIKCGPFLFGQTSLAAQSDLFQTPSPWLQFEPNLSSENHSIRVRGYQATPGYWYINPSSSDDPGEDALGWVDLNSRWLIGGDNQVRVQADSKALSASPYMCPFVLRVNEAESSVDGSIRMFQVWKKKDDYVAHVKKCLDELQITFSVNPMEMSS